MLIKRETYLRKIRPYYDTDLIKVLTGIRRCGKSKLLAQIKDELSAKGIPDEQILSINFEDLSYSSLNTAESLHAYITSKIKNKDTYYIFLDEIQNVDHFEKALASFKAALNCSLFVTGSNSRLLSGELATLLTGRTKEFLIQPFSYSEACEYRILCGMKIDDDFFYDYLKWGGFPQRFDLPDESGVYTYLSDLYSSIKYKDITSRQKIDHDKFDKFSAYLLANCGYTFSSENIANYLNTNENGGKRDISKGTLYTYAESMEKAFLIKKVQRYDIAGKSVLQTQEKFYAVDTGLRTLNTNTVQYQDTFYLENIVYNELILRDYRVYTGKTQKGEIDFIAVKNGRKCFIQVCYLLSGEKTVEREFSAFTAVKDASPKYVLSLDKVDFSHDGITHLNIIDFLSGKKDIVVL